MSDVPAWFTRAIAAEGTAHVAHADGLPVHYLRWGASDKPPVLLIHGGGAHALWWGFIAPLLEPRFDVLALDLTGHGDSGRRDRYPREVWAADVLAVIDHAGLTAPPYLVGHSMGGFVSLVMASLHGARIAGAILVDSPVRPRREKTEPSGPAPEPKGAPWTLDRIRPYPDLDSALQRFRLVPDQPIRHPWLVDYVARRSIRHDPDGFTWKFDPKVFERASTTSLHDYLTTAACPLALVRGEESVVLPRDIAEAMVAAAPRGMPLVEIPGAQHHVMFDEPVALTVALRSILAVWTSARPPT